MPQNTTKNVPAATWTQLTDANISTVTFQNISGSFVLIKGTVGAVAPTNREGAIRYNPGQGERNVLLSDLFPGLSGVNRLYAFSQDGASVVISHA